MKPALLIERVAAGAVAPGEFGHREHLLAAYELLAEKSFLGAAMHYGETINAFARRAGAADKFSVTVTLAFLGLIAERMAREDYPSFDAFLAANPDLAGSPIRDWYSPERIASALSRRVFLLPDRAPLSAG